MAVNFSPYSKIPGKTPEPPWQIPEYFGPSASTKGTSSLADEVAALTKQFNKSKAAIMADPNLSPEERKKKIAILTAMRDTGNFKGSPYSSVGNFLGALGTTALGQAQKYVAEPLLQTSRALQVGATELILGAKSIPGEILRANNLSTDDMDARTNKQLVELDEFLAAKNYSNPEYNIFGSYSPFEITDTSLGGQGKWVGPVARFGADVAFDPSTYLTLGASTASRASRISLATRFGTTEMLEKYPMMADRLNLVARFGEAAIPENVRWAEGIESGTKFMGQRIQGTDAVASLWMKTGGAARAAVGDAIYATSPGKKLLAYTAPKSLRPLVVSGIGRSNAKGEFDDFIRGLAVFSSDKYRRATLITVNKQLQAEIGPAFAVAKEAGVDMNLVTQVMENPTLYGSVTDEPTKTLIDALTNWYAGVGDGYRQAQRLLGDDYDIAVSEMAFIDDYVFHTLSKEGKAYRFGTAGSEGGMFNKGDISARDLIEGDGTVLFRKYRAAKLDEFGKPIDPEMFFDQPVIKGTIEEMNGIFDRYMVSQGEKAGQKWFETGADVVAKGYATSIANAHGRVKFIRRMFDFGDYAIEPMLYDIIPDKALADKLSASTAVLKSIVGSLRRKASKSAGTAATKVVAGDGLEDVTNVAIAVLAGNRMASDAASAENLAAIAEVDKLMRLLEEARAAAVASTAVSRTEFEAVWINELAEARALREALVRGEGERFAALKILRTEYLTLHPTASVYEIDNASAEWLAESIVRRYSDGKSVSRIEKRLEKDIEKLEQKLINAGANDNLDEIDDALNEARTALGYAEDISNIKRKASYASDGVLYRTWGDSGHWSTKPPTENVSEWQKSGTGAMSIAVDEMDLVDTRLVSAMDNLLTGQNESGAHNFLVDAIATTFNRLPMPDTQFFEVAMNAIDNGTMVDELYKSVYPQHAELIDTILRATRFVREMADNGMEELPQQVITDLFVRLRSDIGNVMRSLDPEVDDIAIQGVFNDILGELGSGTKLDGLLIPMAATYPNLPASVTDNQWSVIDSNRLYNYDFELGPNGEQKVFDGSVASERERALYGRGTNVVMSADSSLGNQVINGTTEMFELSLRESVEPINATTKSLAQIDTTEMTLARATDKTVTVDGVKTPVRDALKRLTGLDKDITVGLSSVDAQIAESVEAKLGVEGLRMGMIAAEARMAMSFDQAAVLKGWDESVGEALSNELGNMILLLESKPAKGSTGALNRKWVKEVTSSLEAVASMEDGPAKEAAEKVLLLVYADEAKLAAATAELDASEYLLGRALTGEDGIRIAKNLKEGWAELKNMGVQVPREVTEIWMPSMERLLSAGQAGLTMRTLNTITDLWKRYVTSTAGFFVRNGMSATFMNMADAIPMADIALGAKWAAAQADTKGRTLAGNTYNNWAERAGVKDMDLADFVQASVAAAGRGVAADNGIPGVSSGSRTRLADNAYLRFFSRKNDFVENMVRMPVAIDSYNRGYTLDQSIARIERLHLNYGDLSGLDAQMKKVVPFWIWTSRNIPLQIAQMTTRPKAYYEYQRLREEFPNETEFTPAWIQDRMPLGIGTNLLTPDLPMVRLTQVVDSLTSPYGIVGQATPWLKLPIEVMYAKKQLGIEVGPFKDKQKATGYQEPLAWIFAQAEQTGMATYDKEGNLLIDPRVNHFVETVLPPLAQLNRLTGGLTGGKDTLEERILSSWANWFGIPLRQVKEDQQRSEVMRRKWMMIDMSGLIEEVSELRENKP
jgi:hypothetical protein